MQHVFPAWIVWVHLGVGRLFCGAFEELGEMLRLVTVTPNLFLGFLHSGVA